MTIDAISRRRRTLVDAVPLLSSATAPWSDCIKFEHHSRCFEIEEHCPDDYVISLFLTSNVFIETSIAGEWQPRVMLCPGDVTIHSRHTPVASRWQRSLEFLTLSLDPALVAQTAEGGSDTAGVNLKFSQGIQDQQVRQVMLALRAELSEGCPSGRLYGEGLATALASHLLQCHAVPWTLNSLHRGGLSPTQVRRVISYIDAHLGEELSLRRLSELIHLSPYHFVRAFRQSTGRSPHRYVLEQRIARAQVRLMEPELSLADVGYELGFASQAHFTTTFRKLVGITPGTWRAKR
jgi:AraC family transcriptional regulator